MRFLILFLAILLASPLFADDGVRQFRGNNTRSYYGSGPIPADSPNTLWKFKTGQQFSKTLPRPWEGLGWTGQPAVFVEENRTLVYIASLDGHVYKIDFKTGALLAKSPDNFYIIKSSPAVTDQYLVVGAWDNCVHILDRHTLQHVVADTAIWTASASYDFDSSPAIEDDYLYIGGEDGYVRKVSLKPPFNRQWVFPRHAPTTSFVYGEREKPYVGIESSVAIAGDRVVVGTGSGWIWILNKYTGKLLARFNSGDDTDSTPVIDPTDNSFYIGVEKDFTENTGGLYKLSMDGTVNWFFPSGLKGVFSTAAIDDERVVFTGDDAYLYSLNKQSGALQWKYKLLDGSWSSPILVDGRIIAADYAGYIYGFQASDGRELWRKYLGSYIVSSPVIWKGTILVGTRDGYLHALK